MLQSHSKAKKHITLRCLFNWTFFRSYSRLGLFQIKNMGMMTRAGFCRRSDAFSIAKQTMLKHQSELLAVAPITDRIPLTGTVGIRSWSTITGRDRVPTLLEEKIQFSRPILEFSRCFQLYFADKIYKIPGIHQSSLMFTNHSFVTWINLYAKQPFSKLTFHD